MKVRATSGRIRLGHHTHSRGLESTKPFVEQLKNYITNNPFKFLGGVGQIIGGSILLVYLGSIGYFPLDFNLGTASWLLFAIFITGILSLALLAMYFVFPGFCYRHLLELPTNDGAIFYLLDFPAFAVALFVIVEASFQITISGCLKFFVFVYAVSIFLKFGLMLKQQPSNDVKDGRLADRVGWIKQEPLNSIWKGFLIIIKTLFLCFVILIPLLFLLFLAAGYQQLTNDEYSAWLVLIAMYTFVVAMNHMVAGAKKWWFPLAISPVVMFALFGMSQQFNWVPKAVVGIFSIGNVRNATLLLDEQGCHVAEQFISPSATNSLKTLNVKPAVCQLSSVNILWRIGGEYFIEVDAASSRQQSLQKTKKFTISSAHVLSWSVAEQKKSVSQ